MVIMMTASVVKIKAHMQEPLTVNTTKLEQKQASNEQSVH